MTDSNQIRINELARELEIKAKVLIDFLPEIGVTEKKTHSSSLDIEHAELARKHFHQLADQEAAAEAAKSAAKKPARPAPIAAANAPVATPRPAATPNAAAVPAHTAPAPAAGAARPAVPTVAPVRPAAVPSAAQGHPSPTPPAAARPATPATSAPAATSRPGAPAVRSRATPTPGHSSHPTTPAQQGPAAAPSTAASQTGQPAHRPGVGPAGAPPRPGTVPSRPTGGQPPMGQRPPVRPGQPLQSRPGAPQGIRPAAAPGQYPGQQRPGGAPRPGSAPPGRYPQRPGSGRPGQGPGGPRPGGPRPGGPGGVGGVPKAEPGKPLYARKPPASRGRPTIEKRFAEGERRLHPVRTRPGAAGARGVGQAEPIAPVQREPRDVVVTEGITIRDLAEKLGIRAKDLLKTLLDRGMFASINQALDVATATSLAESFNGIVKVVTFEEQLVQEEKVREERTGNQLPRAPVVTVMGHVDHGKTSLLDAVRETEVAAGEAGGITQHIGAYESRLGERRIVFIDTPGHEAFTRMRARGAKVTDIVVLVVAADDGVMPQTEEAIAHAKAAGVPIIVAVNKIDKPDAQPERVKRQMADRGLMPEEWGGETVMVDVSAKTKKNLPRLLEMILLVADLRELKADPDAPASGTVLESRVDKGRGPVATVLVQNGTLHVGDVFIVGAVYGKVRAMFDDRGRPIKQAGPATPVEVLGLQGVPEAGDQFQVADEAKARHIVEYRQSKQREASLAKTASGR
ncbi:MAG: translation initiation factor IF-2, partial [Candidatus Acidiferrales bacterium]